MNKKFCYVCKQHVDLPDDPKKAEEAFNGSGHSDRRVARLQRNLGRKQRELSWQR